MPISEARCGCGTVGESSWKVVTVLSYLLTVVAPIRDVFVALSNPIKRKERLSYVEVDI